MLEQKKASEMTNCHMTTGKTECHVCVCVLFYNQPII